MSGCLALGTGVEGAQTIVGFSSLAENKVVAPDGMQYLQLLIENVYEAQPNRKTDYQMTILDFACGASTATNCVSASGGSYINSFGTGMLGQFGGVRPVAGYNVGSVGGPHESVLLATGCTFDGANGSCSMSLNEGDRDGYDVAKTALSGARRPTA